MKKNLNGLQVNKKVLLSDPTDKVFCQEDYAQELYDKMFNHSKLNNSLPRGGKDLEKGQFLPITDISSVSENEIWFEVNNMTAIPVNINKEKRFFEYFGYTKDSFIDWVRLPQGRKEFLKEEHLVYIEKAQPSPSGSLFEGLQNIVKTEFFDQIKNPTKAYYAKVNSKNQGGFFIEVQGIQAFLPGGLAAANKIVNFDSYIGKTIPVMVEDYLADINTFIFSNKKYIQHVLPKLVAELDVTKKLQGFVTGTNKHGVFIEFDETFTGLLHTSKMTPGTKKYFDERRFQPGDEMEVWVIEINRSNQLVLSEYERGAEENYEKSLLEQGVVYPCELTAIRDFGIFVKLTGNDKEGNPRKEIGLIPSKSDNNYLFNVGDTTKKVRLKNTREGKHYFEFATN